MRWVGRMRAPSQLQAEPWRESPQHRHSLERHGQLPLAKTGWLFTHGRLGPARPWAFSTRFRRCPHLANFRRERLREQQAHDVPPAVRLRSNVVLDELAWWPKYARSYRWLVSRAGEPSGLYFITGDDEQGDGSCLVNRTRVAWANTVRALRRTSITLFVGASRFAAVGAAVR
jgi:hypothetical protein